MGRPPGARGQRYFAQRGNHFAAAITFFSILTAVPLLMVAFAAASYVLWFNPLLLAELERAIADAVPSGLAQAVNPILETAIEQRNSIAGVGLVGALWSGVWWMSNLREAVSAQWELPAPNPAALQRLVFDLRALAGLGSRCYVTLAFTVLGTGLTEVVLRLLGAPDDGVTRALLRVVGAVLGVVANWLIFAWAITRLPRTDVALRGVRRAALLGAVGFEALKQGAAVYFERDHGHPGRRGLRLPARPAALRLPRGAAAAVGDGVGGHLAWQRAHLSRCPAPGAVVLRQEVVRTSRPFGGRARRRAGAGPRGRGVAARPERGALTRPRNTGRMSDPFAATARGRRAVADLLDGLDEARFGTPSLCAGWSVKVVAGHLAAAVTTPTRAFLRELLRQRGNGHATNTVLARKLAELPASELAALLREHADRRVLAARRGPVGAAGRRAGPRRRHAPAARPPAHPRPGRRPARAGVRHDRAPGGLRPAWRAARPAARRHGSGRGVGRGEELSGRAVDILMAGCGRTAVLPSLTGAGVAVLAGRLTTRR